MHKRFRKTLKQPNILDSSSDEATANRQINKLVVRRKYVRTRRKDSAPVNISDTSSDEATTSAKLDQENRKWLPNLERYSSDPSALSVPPLKFQPLAVSLSAKLPSPSKPADLLDIPTSGLTDTPVTSRRTVLTSSNQDESLNNTGLNRSIANLESMVNTQQTPRSIRKNSTAPNKRCIKGGFVQEYKRLMLRERMDRRSLAHNQRLGLSSCQRVRVLSTSVSFGVSKARVQVVTTAEQNKEIFHIIIGSNLESSISVGSNLELYFDLNVDSALQLPNKELVYVQPNKIVLL